jgi:hypothetical protein
LILPQRDTEELSTYEGAESKRGEPLDMNAFKPNSKSVVANYPISLPAAGNIQVKKNSFALPTKQQVLYDPISSIASRRESQRDGNRHETGEETEVI